MPSTHTTSCYTLAAPSPLPPVRPLLLEEVYRRHFVILIPLWTPSGPPQDPLWNLSGSPPAPLRPDPSPREPAGDRQQHGCVERHRRLHAGGVRHGPPERRPRQHPHIPHCPQQRQRLRPTHRP
eukprot:7444564-Pyramimonas_sp.AAC.3